MTKAMYVAGPLASSKLGHVAAVSLSPSPRVGRSKQMAEPIRIYMHDSLPRTGHIRVHTLPDLGPRWADEYIFIGRDGKRR